MRSLALTVCSALLFAAVMAPRAEAQFPAFTQTQTLNNLGFGVNTTRGWAFTVSARIVVEQLGFWDEAGTAGLAEAHPIGVWSNDGTLLTSATVPAGTAAPLETRSAGSRRRRSCSSPARPT